VIKRTLGFVATICLSTGLPQAHHSLAGVYDMKGEEELSGTVTSVKFTNPHRSLALAVKNQDGSSTEIVPGGRVIHNSAGSPND
jgi:Family of unknown function (DUF6152)